MLLKGWKELPSNLQIPEVKKYYEILSQKRGSLILKRLFDVSAATVMLIILSPVMLFLSIWIVLDSKGGAFYRQERITAYGKTFRIHKFRTMVSDADKIGSQITAGKDVRITKVGQILRKYRLDELPQLLDVIRGSMSFVGTRPEVPKYVAQYTNEMRATLLLPAGITSEASIRYKDEAKLLEKAQNIDEVYINEVLPGKMVYNLQSLEQFSFCNEIKTMLRTVAAVLK